jgi:hypothetical protein
VTVDTEPPVSDRPTEGALLGRGDHAIVPPETFDSAPTGSNVHAATVVVVVGATVVVVDGTVVVVGGTVVVVVDVVVVVVADVVVVVGVAVTRGEVK